jgi:integrase
MARTVNRLTARTAASAKEGLHADGGGLYLCVGSGSSKSWVFIYRRGGKRTELGLGSCRDVSLATARDTAADCRKRLLNGGDPRRRRDDPSVPTFGAFADKYIDAHERSWSNPKHVAQWKMTLGVYAASLRNKSVDEVSIDDVLAVLRPLWSTVPETASRLRGRIEAVLDAAKAKRLRTGENPAAWKGNLKHLLPARAKLSRGHHAAMPYKDIAAFIAKLRSCGGVAARALEFAILTAARSNEVRSATWEEIDTEAKVWTVPASRMKSRRDHRVPLSARAIEILDYMGRAGRHGLIFPGRRGRPLSESTFAALLRWLHFEVTAHGFRSTFKDWAAETTTFANERSEAALAHVTGDKVERAYLRGDVLERRRELMAAWASFCETPAARGIAGD